METRARTITSASPEMGLPGKRAQLAFFTREAAFPV
jgi:hypothetical protein